MRLNEVSLLRNQSQHSVHLRLLNYKDIKQGSIKALGRYFQIIMGTPQVGDYGMESRKDTVLERVIGIRIGAGHSTCT